MFFLNFLSFNYSSERSRIPFYHCLTFGNSGVHYLSKNGAARVLYQLQLKDQIEEMHSTFVERTDLTKWSEALTQKFFFFNSDQRPIQTGFWMLVPVDGANLALTKIRRSKDGKWVYRYAQLGFDSPDGIHLSCSVYRRFWAQESIRLEKEMKRSFWRRINFWALDVGFRLKFCKLNHFLLMFYSDVDEHKIRNFPNYQRFVYDRDLKTYRDNVNAYRVYQKFQNTYIDQLSALHLLKLADDQRQKSNTTGSKIENEKQVIDTEDIKSTLRSKYTEEMLDDDGYTLFLRPVTRELNNRILTISRDVKNPDIALWLTDLNAATDKCVESLSTGGESKRTANRILVSKLLRQQSEIDIYRESLGIKTGPDTLLDDETNTDSDDSTVEVAREDSVAPVKVKKSKKKKNQTKKQQGQLTFKKLDRKDKDIVVSKTKTKPELYLQRIDKNNFEVALQDINQKGRDITLNRLVSSVGGEMVRRFTEQSGLVSRLENYHQNRELSPTQVDEQMDWRNIDEDRIHVGAAKQAMNQVFKVYDKFFWFFEFQQSLDSVVCGFLNYLLDVECLLMLSMSAYPQGKDLVLEVTWSPLRTLTAYYKSGVIYLNVRFSLGFDNVLDKKFDFQSMTWRDTFQNFVKVIRNLRYFVSR